MRTQMLPIAALRPPERNVRVHPEQQLRELGKAVEMFGQTRPVVIDEENTVLAGNGLVEACAKIGMTHVAVYYMTGLTKQQKQKLILSDNRVFELGFADNQTILEMISSFEGDFNIPGFDAEILANIHNDTHEVTAEAIAGYGVLPQAGVEAARANPLPTPVAGGQPQYDDEVICPKCGKGFTP